ncbi:hypothetical protein AB3S75_006354 [Citrus x aurantiifolia]
MGKTKAEATPFREEEDERSMAVVGEHEMLLKIDSCKARPSHDGLRLLRSRPSARPVFRRQKNVILVNNYAIGESMN